MKKPFYKAATENSEPVFTALGNAFRRHQAVLEIGSGSGQQAVYFCERIPDLKWFSSDLVAGHAGIQSWIQASNCPNLQGPLTLDVSQPDWPSVEVDAVYASNVVHLMSDTEIQNLFSGVSMQLPEEGCFYLYGPFKVDGVFLSEMDRNFDEMLRDRNPAHGLRSVDVLESLAEDVGLMVKKHISMPKNNQILCWSKSGDI